MKSPRNRRPRAPSSVLAALGTLQLGALGLLLRGDFMDSLPNYYIDKNICAVYKEIIVCLRNTNKKCVNVTHSTTKITYAPTTH